MKRLKKLSTTNYREKDEGGKFEDYT